MLVSSLGNVHVSLTVESYAYRVGLVCKTLCHSQALYKDTAHLYGTVHDVWDMSVFSNTY